MAPKPTCAKYQYVVTAAGPKILPVDEPSCKDEESPADYNAGGYLPVKVNDTFKQGRYRVVRKLGWGHFSTVWLVKDSQTTAHSALKVVKSAGRYAETARDEIKLLSQVSSISPNHPGRAHIVSFLDSFSHQGPDSSHICIVFEPLGENLLALIERNKKKGVSRALVKVIAKQMLMGLQYLHDECDLVHTDIKPENILISIPDIETHIQSELCQSPSPTSRRVGVPLPTKSRSGVTIPYNQQRARRQVQIFDSQPLSSPSRSVGRSAAGTPSFAMSRAPDTGSGTNSQSSSYIAPANLLRSVKNGASLPPSNGFIGGSIPSSSIPKIPSNLSASFPAPQSHHNSSTIAPCAAPSSDAQRTSPSSSNSSISSAVGSTTGGCSSIISTPPTSLSQSMTGAVANFMSPCALPEKARALLAVSDGSQSKGSQRLSVHRKKAEGHLEAEFSAALSNSWKSPSIPASWNEKTSSSLSSSYKSKSSPLKASKPRSSNSYGHNRSHSGAVAAASWQDPGTAAPAPAVVVSAVVGADNQVSNVATVANVRVLNSEDATSTSTGISMSESSSATATLRPSPIGTPASNLTKGKTLSIINGVSKHINDTSINLPDGVDAKAAGLPHHASLLTQTAPLRSVATPTTQTAQDTTASRQSPPKQISQLSAHMHAHQASSLTSCSISQLHCIGNHNTGTHQHEYPNFPSHHTLPRDIHPPHPNQPLPPTSLVSELHIPSTAAVVEERVTRLDTAPPVVTPPPPISVKIADLGNATPSKKHYTEDIQTRQYRAPEAIVGRRDWDARADIWSIACVVFELLTAEYLFDPQGQGELFTKDDDHMAQIIELLGDFPLEVKMGGKYSRELFDHNGALRYIRTLKPWPLKRVMTEKYLYTEDDATSLCSFLGPMLAVDFRDRINARDMLKHTWLDFCNEDEIVDW